MHLDFFEGVEIPFKEQGEYKVCIHTKEVDNALKITHSYLGDKYIKMLSGKYNLYGQPENSLMVLIVDQLIGITI